MKLTQADVVDFALAVTGLVLFWGGLVGLLYAVVWLVRGGCP